MPQTMEISTKYLRPTQAAIKLGYYSNNRPALQIVSSTGELLMTATVNLPNEYLQPNQVFIKNYSENAGILAVLQEKQIIRLIDRQINSGFVWIDVAELRPTTDWLLPVQE